MRRFNSSTNRTALLRRQINRCQAWRRWVSGVLRLMATRKSPPLRRSRWTSVFRFGPSRCMIFFLPVVLVTDTSIVRSSRNLPSRTFSSNPTAPCSK